ncbi:hypothetical protein N7462_007748 [Penicillium macrosclerotiorum]|uniref:uncharacterized protein n=1 Tax=Penicillium macrosclerotiorum TaxID=303699 RepID=UPI0025479CED|nr:uncharacterized protein N7462_007748 [Penicillium macrosclerotiorum]KAJ5679504.1 hypothetical protein N7462_007748 [Penicillium macrosclerotiorum]
MSAESPGQKPGLRSFFSNALRPKKSRQTLRKGSRSTTDLRLAIRSSVDEAPPPMPDIAPLQAHRIKYKEVHANLDSQLGERRDYTTMIHTLGVLEPEDSYGPAQIEGEFREPGEGDIAKLSPTLWARIVEYLDPAEAASLAIASITLYRRLGPGFFRALEMPENYEHKIQFLVGLDRSLPHHLLCFPCGRFHRRTQEGQERMRPAHVLNPLFNCPNAQNSLNPPPRHRITHGRTMPFSFVQLTMRAHRFGRGYGVPAEDLGRRWQRDGWSHSSRFYINEGRLLMRVTSQTFATPALSPSQQRMLLYSREDYWPFFSACAHWRDGELMTACKCALDHIPAPRSTGGLQPLEHKVKDRWQGRTFDPNALTTLCGFCRPMRRCPECPSEYLIEVKLSEDRSDQRGTVFKQAIVVTRWTDLGDGTVPSHLEWAAINGKRDDYDSFKHYEKRGIASIFEAAFTADTLPGQRVISMNPKHNKKGEDGNDWY